MSLKEMETLTGKILMGLLRLLQLVLACAVIGLYGQYLNWASQRNEHADGRWVWAVVVGSLSALTAIIYAIPFFPLRFFFIWDIIIWMFWLIVFGIFAKLYIHEDPEGDHQIQQMRDAVWLDLINWILWLFSAVVGFFYFYKYRNQRTTWTSRARENTKV